MTLLIPVIWMFFSTGFFCLLARRRFGFVLPGVLLTVSPVLYASQFLFRSFTPGVWLLAVPAVGFLPAYIISLGIADRRSKECDEKCKTDDLATLLFSPGFYALLAILCIYLVIDFKRPLTKWDELKHWGMMVKEMFRLDRFYAVTESNLLAHKDYPPFAPLLELFWCRLYGTYTEMGVSMAAHLFTMSVILGPLAEMTGGHAFRVEASVSESTIPGKIDTKKIIIHRSMAQCGNQILLALCLMVFILAFDGFHVFMTIYTDIMIAAVFAYAIFLVFTDRGFKDVWGSASLILACSALLGIKEVGVGFWLLVVFYGFLQMAVRAFKKQRSIERTEGAEGTDGNGSRCESSVRSERRAVVLALAAGIPAAGLILWHRFISAFPMEKQFDLSDITPGDLLNVIRGSVEGSGGSRLHETLIRFIVAVFQENVCPGFFPVTVVSAMLISFLILILLHRRFRNSFSAAEAGILGITFACGTAGYSLMVLVAYLFGMEPREMEELISFPRYMSSYVLAEALVLLLIGVSLAVGEPDRAVAPPADISTGGPAGLRPLHLSVLLLILCVSLCPANLLYFVPQKLHGNPRYPFRLHAEKLAGAVEPGAKVFLMADSTSDDYQVFVSYYANELRIYNRDFWAFKADYRNHPERRDQVLKEFLENDYIYVIDTNPVLQEAFADNVEGGKMQAGVIYRVEDRNGQVRLAEVKEDHQ